MSFLSNSLDATVIFIFLGITLLIGLFSSGKIKNFKDYAMGGERGFSNTILFATLSATVVGGYSIMGVSGQIYKAGIIFFISSICSVISYIIVFSVILPRIDYRFEGSLSIVDIMTKLYGKAAGKISAVFGILNCVGVLCIQFIALGNLLSGFLGISYEYSLLLPSILLIIYSTIGGIRSVAMTDLIQFCVLIIMVPLLAKLAVDANGGLINVFANVPSEKYRVFSHPEFWAYMLFACCRPFIMLKPTLMHRFLMIRSSKSRNKIAASFIFVIAFLAIMTLLIPFAMFNHCTDCAPNQVISSAMNLYLPAGLKGFMIAGLLAAVMSTADSYLNTASVLAGQLFNFSDKKPVISIKFITIAIATTALFISLKNYDILYVGITIDILLAPLLCVPIFLGICNVPIKRSLYFISSGVSLVVLGILKLMGTPILYLTFVSIVTSCSILLSKQILSLQWVVYIKKFLLHLCSVLQKCIEFRTFSNLNSYLRDMHTNYSGSHILFALFCTISYVMPLAKTNYIEGKFSSLVIVLYAIAIILCTILLMREHLGKTFNKYFGLYWCITLTFCLPFMTSFLFLQNNGALFWSINVVLSNMLLACLTSWGIFVTTVFVGSCMSIIIHYLILSNTLNIVDSNLDIILYSTIFSLLIGGLFIRQRQKQQDEQVKLTQFFAGVIAHELKSPLAAMKMQAEATEGITRNKRKISEDDVKFINESSNALLETAENGLRILETLLIAIRKRFISEDEGDHSVHACLIEAISKYKLIDPNNVNKINVITNGEDFTFHGSRVFMVRLFDNLIRNAFKHGGNGIDNLEVTILFNKNQIIISDNGCGISPNEIDKIFQKLYTSSETGTGLGLAFCKGVMEQIGGTIDCESKEGKYTKFILRFPSNYERKIH